MKITIIGAGLAGCEAALQLAKAGYDIDLYEMRPKTKTPAHQTDLFAELVCSNSLKSSLLTTASGLLKAEMEILGCELLKIAYQCAVPAGNALAVDRNLFSECVTSIIKNHKNINFINEEYILKSECGVRSSGNARLPLPAMNDDAGKMPAFPEIRTPIILACGPLMSDKLTASLIKIICEEHLYFFDAIAPIIAGDSIDFDKVFSQSRYDKEFGIRSSGNAGILPAINYDAGKMPAFPELRTQNSVVHYLNCPFDKEEYETFVNALLSGEKHQAKEFENEFFNNIDFKYYENCLPIEELAKRGKDTLRFGVMKPVGLTDPKTNRRPYAVIQLRAENKDKTAYNLVGCQTMLKYADQKRIFTLIPGLENAEFLRYGSIHRNTYLNTPFICNPDFSLKNAPNIFLAGQITGVEGYVESICSGLLTALIITKKITSLPEETIIGQLWRYLTTPNDNFVPMNANFGLLPEIYLEKKNRNLKKNLMSQRSLSKLVISNC